MSSLTQPQQSKPGTTATASDRGWCAPRQATLAKLRAQSSAATRDWGARNARLAAEKDAVVREHVMLKAGLGSFRATQALRLKQLSVCRRVCEGRTECSKL